jgi:hypothetical protein
MSIRELKAVFEQDTVAIDTEVIQHDGIGELEKEDGPVVQA